MANITAVNINNTSARGVIQDLLFTADYYDLFEIELWNYNLTEYFYTVSWIDSSSVYNYTYYDISGLAEGTGYSFKAFAKSGGNRNYIGAYSFYTTSPEPDPPVRPSNWSWSTLVPSAITYTVGEVLRANVVSATEWNNFCSRINEFRSYKNLSNYSFTTVSPNQSFTNVLVTEGINAISPMAPASWGSGPYSTLINLSTALNSIS